MASILFAALPRDNPRIEDVADTYQIGDILTGNCVSAPADPTPILTWYINNQQVRIAFFQI